MKKRQLYQNIWEELSSEKGMIFLTGPRQAGKTTLAKLISRGYPNHFYANWDIAEDRVRFLESPLFFTELRRKDGSTPLIVFDEIHKFRDWKNYLKGIFDDFHKEYQFLISGSGRLDTYQKGADSLAGRYFLFHLWPLTISELAGTNQAIDDFLDNPLHVSMDNTREFHDVWNDLQEYSGFPEPFLSGKKTTYRRWANTYTKQIIHEDIRDLTDLKSIVDIETLYYLLPSKVGSSLSVPSLSRNLKVSFNSVQKWLGTFESFFLTFSISPWSKSIARAIHKEKKLYLWDTPRIKDPGARFENQVAMELFRAITSWNDMGHGQFALHYIKNKEQQEVDFLIVNEQEPLILIEAKLSDREPSAALKKFQNQLNIPAVQLTGEAEFYKLVSNKAQKILVAPACQWLAGLP